MEKLEKQKYGFAYIRDKVVAPAVGRAVQTIWNNTVEPLVDAAKKTLTEIAEQEGLPSPDALRDKRPEALWKVVKEHYLAGVEPTELADIDWETFRENLVESIKEQIKSEVGKFLGQTRQQAPQGMFGRIVTTLREIASAARRLVSPEAATEHEIAQKLLNEDILNEIAESAAQTIEAQLKARMRDPLGQQLLNELETIFLRLAAGAPINTVEDLHNRFMHAINVLRTRSAAYIRAITPVIDEKTLTQIVRGVAQKITGDAYYTDITTPRVPPLPQEQGTTRRIESTLDAIISEMTRTPAALRHNILLRYERQQETLTQIQELFNTALPRMETVTAPLKGIINAAQLGIPATNFFVHDALNKFTNALEQRLQGVNLPSLQNIINKLEQIRDLVGEGVRRGEVGAATGGAGTAGGAGATRAGTTGATAGAEATRGTGVGAPAATGGARGIAGGAGGATGTIGGGGVSGTTRTATGAEGATGAGGAAGTAGGTTGAEVEKRRLRYPPERLLPLLTKTTDPWKRAWRKVKPPAPPKSVTTIMNWLPRLTNEERNRIMSYLYRYWLALDKDEKKEALKQLERVAKEMGIPVR